MPRDIAAEIAALREMTVPELRAKYLEVFGEEPRSKHRVHLFHRVAWRIQALEEGGLSERAKERAQELACEADLRVVPPRGAFGSTPPPPAGKGPQPSPAPIRDWRLPMPGSCLRKEYRGQILVVQVLERGFEFNGRPFRSLSGVAKTITGTHLNGYSFFGLARGKRNQ